MKVINEANELVRVIAFSPGDPTVMDQLVDDPEAVQVILGKKIEFHVLPQDDVLLLVIPGWPNHKTTFVRETSLSAFEEACAALLARKHRGSRLEGVEPV